MKRIALIKDGVVETVASWDGTSDWNPGADYTQVDVTSQPEVGKGWSYDGSIFQAPLD